MGVRFTPGGALCPMLLYTSLRLIYKHNSKIHNQHIVSVPYYVILSLIINYK